MSLARSEVDWDSLRSIAKPGGIPFDPEDAPTLSREIQALCQGLKCPRPPIVYTAEFAIRLHEERAMLGIRRTQTLALGWPLLHCLDADEVRAAMALALCGQPVALPLSPEASADARVAKVVGEPLLQRLLCRMLSAAELALEWWPPEACTLSAAEAWRSLRRGLEQRGRAHWQAAYQQGLARNPAAGARIAALQGSELAGGSHRSAAVAWLWEALVDRLWTQLESRFRVWPLWRLDTAPPAAESEHRAAPSAIEAEPEVECAPDPRRRLRELEALRRAGQLDADGLAELARGVELAAGARAAHALYRELYQMARTPEHALALARTLVAVDLPRGRAALQRIAESRHPVAQNAQAMLTAIDAAGQNPPTQLDLLAHG